MVDLDLSLHSPAFRQLLGKLLSEHLGPPPPRPVPRRVPFEEAYRRYIEHDYPPTPFGEWLYERDREALGIELYDDGRAG